MSRDITPRIREFVIASSTVAIVLFSRGQDSIHGAEWPLRMREVHAQFDGLPGMIARFGDSITISQAFFAPLRNAHQNVAVPIEPALAWMQEYVPANVWIWQSPATGADGATTSAWPLMVEQSPPVRNVDHWLASLNPEIAVIMWGTVDLFFEMTIQDYAANVREVLTTVLAAGTIPVLTTAPPFHAFEEEAAEFASAMRALAEDLRIPLIDYHAEILARDSGDSWNGSLVYEEGSVYEVERLIAGDGFHPSNPTAYHNSFSEEALNRSGFALRNYMTLLALYDVYNLVIDFPAADFSGDGMVDRLDLDVWREGAGKVEALQFAGDSDGDEDVDGDDLLELLRQFGGGQAANSAAQLSGVQSADGTTSVPEPNCRNAALILAIIIAGAHARNRSEFSCGLTCRSGVNGAQSSFVA